MTTAFDLLLAWSAIVSIADAPSEPPYFLPAVQSVAISLEIMDWKESPWLCRNWNDWPQDIKILRERYNELADAPPLCDSTRWPNKETLNDCLTANFKYRQWLDTFAEQNPDQAFTCREIQAEVEALYKVYDACRDAKCDYFYIHVRRRQLAKLRELIGLEAYYSGQLPPYLPLWYFWSAD